MLYLSHTQSLTGSSRPVSRSHLPETALGPRFIAPLATGEVLSPRPLTCGNGVMTELTGICQLWWLGSLRIFIYWLERNRHRHTEREKGAPGQSFLFTEPSWGGGGGGDTGPWKGASMLNEPRKSKDLELSEFLRPLVWTGHSLRRLSQ